MKVCIISPASHLRDFAVHGDAEMALSHIVLNLEGLPESTVSKYVEYYRLQSRAGKFVILDNSAYEIGKLEKTSATGEGLGADLVLKAAEIIRPSIVICQDVLCNSEGTLESTRKFIEQVKNQGLLGQFKLMAVPQGRTEAEWLKSYQDLSKIEEINMLGFSKISIPISFGGSQQSDGCITTARLRCTGRIDRDFPWKKPVHLLGGDNHLAWELSQQKRYGWIYSNDSSAAVQYGLHDKAFDPDTGKIEHIITKKPDLENKIEETATLLDSKKAVILHNIAVLQRLSKIEEDNL